MELQSDAFQDGETIPEQHTCDGQDQSPPLTIDSPPAGAEAFAIVVEDPDAPGGTFDHWLIWNIPSDQLEIPPNLPQKETLSMLGDAVQGMNDFNELGYRGPCPPEGPAHHYQFSLYVLDSELSVDPGATKAQLRRALEGRTLEQTTLTGIYKR